MNWHLPVIDSEALELKRFLVRELDQQDISTHSLTLSIKTKREIFFFTSIVIEKIFEIGKSPGDHYNVLHARNFNPANMVYETYAKGVKKEMIPPVLIELSKLYFRQLNPEKENGSEITEEVVLNSPVSSYQCSNCLTIYDKKCGDPLSGILAGTDFQNLPDSYKCHVCDSPKKYFIPFQTKVI